MRASLRDLAALYDEESTTQVLKIDHPVSGQTILDFWFANANTDRFSGKKLELQSFKPPEPPK